MSDESTIFIITADKIADTGTVSWKFLFDSKPSEVFLDKVMGLPYGYVWQPDMREGTFSFNVFESGRGLLVGGGWTPHDSEGWQKEMADAVPGSVLLMRTAVFEWLRENILEKYGRQYERHHCEQILAPA